MNVRVATVTLLAAIVITHGSSGGEAADKAVALVEKLGGSAKRDAKKAGRPVISVELRNTKATDADLKELAVFKQLVSLCLDNTQVTDTGLKELAAFKQLVV